MLITLGYLMLAACLLLLVWGLCAEFRDIERDIRNLRGGK